jgi:hypothetical protein
MDWIQINSSGLHILLFMYAESNLIPSRLEFQSFAKINVIRYWLRKPMNSMISVEVAYVEKYSEHGR